VNDSGLAKFSGLRRQFGYAAIRIFDGKKLHRVVSELNWIV
jgi:hypothetical protein